MKLAAARSCHLTYCSNIHPGETWDDHAFELNKSLPKIKQQLSPDDPFGIGLRLSARASEELLTPGSLDEFSAWLNDNDCYLCLINGFPYGEFHAGRVKENVYSPDWTHQERYEYTARLINILGSLLPEELHGGISTSPLSYKPWLSDPESRLEVYEKASFYLARLTAVMARVEAETGRHLHIDLEPEPDCLLENSEECARFFNEWLLTEGKRELGRQTGVTIDRAETLLRRHIQICYDTCHFAIAFESPSDALDRFKREGIGVGRLQISSALKVRWSQDKDDRQKQRDMLSGFTEPVYLHQVATRRGNGSTRTYRDLDLALSNEKAEPGDEWRIHFHIPVFLENFGLIDSTREHIREALPIYLSMEGPRLLEVETYTWDLLPAELKRPLEESVARELEWVKEETESCYRQRPNEMN